MDILGAQKLIQLLAKARHFGLGMNLCEYLGEPVEPLLIDWACVQVKVH